MLDIHDAHHAATTWREFLIHIATIVLGLLIAIGLEQTVEAIHHSHQRHHLQEDLHGETLTVHANLQRDLHTMAVERLWLLALRRDVDTMRASGGKARPVYRARPAFDPDDPAHPRLMMMWPPDGVWQTAKASALVSLLPEWQAEIYYGLSVQQLLTAGTISNFVANQTDLIAFETQFDDGGLASTPDLSRMSAAQLDQYSAMLTRNLTLRDTFVNRAKIYDASVVAVLAGAKSRDEIGRSIMRQSPDLER